MPVDLGVHRGKADKVITGVAELVPMLRENAAKAEQTRRVPDSNVEALIDAGLLRLSAPRARGGIQANLAEQTEALSHVARGCPSTGWLATSSLAAQWVTALFPDAAQDDVFGTTDLRISGALSPSGEAVRDGTEIVLNGRWQSSAGCLGSQWFVLGCAVDDDDGRETPYLLLVPASDLTIVEDPTAAGLTAAGGHTVVADDVRAPAHRMLLLDDMLAGSGPGSTVAQDPYFARPGIAVVNALMAGVPRGLAHGAMDIALAELPDHRLVYTRHASIREAPLTHHRFGACRLDLVSLDAQVRALTGLADDLDRGLGIRERVAIRAHLGHTAALALRIVDTLSSAGGSAGLANSPSLQRFRRDAHVLALQDGIQPELSAELLGRSELGLAPDTTYL